MKVKGFGGWDEWPAWLGLYPYIASAGMVILGALGMAGWYLDIRALRASWSDDHVMKVNAAAGLFLLGISLLLVLPGEVGGMRRKIARGLAAVVILIGGATLLEIVTGADLGIDRMLLWGSAVAAGDAAERMSVPLACIFIATGLAVLVMEKGVRGFRPADVLGMLVVITGSVPLLAYLLGANWLYGTPEWTDIALQSSLAAILGGIAVLLARPEQGFMSVVTEGGTAGTIVRRLMLPILLFPVLVAWVQVRVLRSNAIEYQYVAVLGTVLIVAVLLSLLVGFGRRLSVAENEREAANDDTRQAQERLAMALLAGQAGAMDWDLATGRITWSREAYMLNGLGSAALPESYGNWMTMVHPDDRQTLSRIKETPAASGEVDIQFRMAGKDKESRWFRVNGRLLHDSEGEATRFMGIAREITAEKLAEMQVRRTAQRLELLYNTTMAVLSTEDAQQAARAVCERVLSHLDCQVMLNYVISERRPDYIEMYSWAGISDEQAKAWSPMHVDGIISGSVVRDGTRIVVEDVPSQPLDPRTNVIRDLGVLAYACHPLLSNGRVIGTIGFGSRTIRRFPLETLALMQAVANHVALAVQRSRASQELAKARAWQERFMAVLSQELRTPLTPIMVATHMLESDPQFRDRAPEQISMIRRNAELEAWMIEAMLDLTRINSQQLQIQHAPVSVHDAIRGAVEACWPEARDRQLILTTDLMAEQDTVSGDAARLQQAIWHILRNSVRFMPSKGTVTLKTGNAPGRIWIRIKDTGAGLGPQEVGRFFEGTARAGLGGGDSGLALGLSISRGLIELHEGEIAVSSEGAGRGTSLDLWLPLATGPALTHKPQLPETARHSRVLVVDDHSDTNRALSRLLTHLGHEVQCAVTVAEGVELAKRSTFDLLISDMALPDGSGIDLLHRVQEIQTIRAIAISGHAMDEDLKRSLNAGFIAHLTKPVSIEQLSMAMSEAMHEQPAATLQA